MVFGFKRGDTVRLDRIEATLQRMLADDRHEFDLAMSALVGGATARTVREDIRETDHRVNQAEREIRRDLIVHASVYGGIDTPAVLVYMSIVKDIERIGDYAKNLVDLARDGASFAEAPDVDAWRALWVEISQMIADTAEIFHVRDGERARALLKRGDEMLDLFDDHVSELVSGQDQSPNAVARAVTYRYLKRVVAHLMNVLSSVVMPVDRIDYFDEDPEDRQG